MCPVSSAALPFVVLHALCHFSLLEFIGAACEDGNVASSMTPGCFGEHLIGVSSMCRLRLPDYMFAALTRLTLYLQYGCMRNIHEKFQ